MKRLLRLLICCFLVGATASACVRRVDVRREEVPLSGDTPLGSASNLPESFHALTPPAVDGDCPPRLADPILQTRLYLVRAIALPVADSAGSRLQAMGDYRVEPPGYYGLLPGDGLRIDCGRLRALAAVRLQ